MNWKVTLYNQFVQRGVSATGRTRRAAFDSAYAKAGAEFLNDRITGPAVTWLGAFNDAVAYMRRGAFSASHDTRRGAVVDIRREPEPDKIKVFDNDASVHMERNDVSGFYTITLQTPSGEIHDKVSVDTRVMANDYWRAFSKIAKTL